MIFLLLIYLLPFTAAYIRDGRNLEIDLDVKLKRDIKRYAPNWDDLDKRPLPQWYDQAKIGIFLHWGVFSVPSFGSEWFWSNWHATSIIFENNKAALMESQPYSFSQNVYCTHVKLGGSNKKINNFMAKNYPPGFTYQEFAPMFTAEFFDPDDWATLFEKSGAKYIVLTSKHHEGFTLFPSKRSFSWNAVEVGPRRDLVGELSKSVRKQGLKFGVYHSLYEWFNPIYAEDKKNHFKTRLYPDTKLWPDLKQLVNDYQPSVLWSDGDWEAYDKYWNSTGLLSWLYNDSPVKDEIVVNDRWGIGCYGKHGDFYNYGDRYNPGTLRSHKWENAFTLDSQSWGYRRNVQLSEILSFDDLLYQVVSTVSCGGNALINVGPTKEGTIPAIYQERLLSLGEWLKINGEAIYGTSPWLYQNDTVNGDVWYTCSKTQYNALHPTSTPTASDTVTAVYAIILKWPQGGELKLKDIMPLLHSGNYKIQLLGHSADLQWSIKYGEAVISLPDKATVNGNNAWTLKFTLK